MHKQNRRKEFLVTARKLNRSNQRHIKWQAQYYLARRRARSFKTAYNIMPFPLAIAVRAALIAFLLLFIMPMHPLTIPASFGGGLSIALLLNIFRI